MRIYKIMALVIACLLSAVALAQESPHAMIEETIERITGRVEQERARLKQDPDYAREVVLEELGDMVDFKRITRLVMDRHFANASTEQRYRFLDVFRESLIATYSSGLTLYDGQNITVLPGQEGDVMGDRARVQTEIRTNEGKVIPVYFSLYRDSDGNWLVENVIVNGLNMGKTFRSQFDQAMQQYNGNIDQVIANWSSDVEVDTGLENQPESADGA